MAGAGARIFLELLAGAESCISLEFVVANKNRLFFVELMPMGKCTCIFVMFLAGAGMRFFHGIIGRREIHMYLPRMLVRGGVRA